MTGLYEYGALAAVVLALIIAAYFYGVHTENNAWGVKQAKADTQAQVQLERQQANNATLAASKAQSDAEITALQSKIASQLPVIEKVYIHVPSKPSVPASAGTVAVGEPVFISVGLLSAYNSSLGLPGPGTPSQPDDAAVALPSAVSLDRYFGTSLANNGVCLANTRQLTLLQDWVRGLGH